MVPEADQRGDRTRAEPRRAHARVVHAGRVPAGSSATAFSDRAARASCGQYEPLEVREQRKQLGVAPVFKRVDTCAAEFESFTPYLYSTYESRRRAGADRSQEGHDSRQRAEPHRAGNRVRLLLLPRVVRAAGVGFETIMVNCNPETVSTDYDTSDRLYFEPLTLEDVLNIVDTEKPDGVIVQFGGQTPLNLALPLKRRACRSSAPIPRTSTSPKIASASASCSTSCRFPSPAERHGHQRRGGLRRRARGSAIPVLVRPSYVLGGRAMVIAYDEETVRQYMREAVTFSQDAPGADRPVPRRRHRSGRRCALRRRRRADRRHHGAHRRGRHSLRRQLLRAAAVLAVEAAELDDHRRLHRASWRRR